RGTRASTCSGSGPDPSYRLKLSTLVRGGKPRFQLFERTWADGALIALQRPPVDGQEEAREKARGRYECDLDLAHLLHLPDQQKQDEEDRGHAPARRCKPRPSLCKRGLV